MWLPTDAKKTQRLNQHGPSPTASFQDSLNPIIYCKAARPFICLWNMALWVTPAIKLSIRRQQDILLRNVAGITAAFGFSGLARSCPMALKLSGGLSRSRVGPLYTLSTAPMEKRLRPSDQRWKLLYRQTRARQKWIYLRLSSPLNGKSLTSPASCAAGESFFHHVYRLGAVL